MDMVVRIDDLDIFYRTEGQGEPVILLHGNGLSHGMWNHNIGPLSRRYKVYAPDLPGFGRSDKPDVDYGSAYYVRFLESFMDVTGIEKAALVGHSFLGVVAATFAVKHPDRVTKLVLADACAVATIGSPLYKTALKAGLWAVMRSRKAFYGSMLYDGAAGSRLDGTWLSPDSRDGRRAFYRNCNEILGLNLDYILLIGSINAPTLVLGGDCDRLVPPKGIKKYGEVIRNARTVIFEKCAHLPNIERPDEFNREVFEFLTER